MTDAYFELNMFKERYIAFGVAIAVTAGGVALARAGLYGYSLFVAFPLLLGAALSAMVRPGSGIAAGIVGGMVGFLGLGILFVAGAAGAVCLVMALPLVLPFVILGAWIASRDIGDRRHWMFLMIPATLAFDTAAKPPLYEVRTALEIAAPPERVWENVVAFPELPPPLEWHFRTGLAYPIRARIEGAGPGAVRYCEFSTGAFVEPIEVWDAPRLLRFRVTENPAPMREWSLWGEAHPKHLHGYMVAERGQFRLTALPGGRTLLEGTTWYRHGLWPAHYWRWWSDAIIHRIHLRVLRHIRTLSDGSG